MATLPALSGQMDGGRCPYETGTAAMVLARNHPHLPIVNVGATLLAV